VAEENPVDPAFLSWAKQWAERPAIAQSAAAEMGRQASSQLQDPLALEDQSASSPERVDAVKGAGIEDRVPGPSAFSVHVQLEYSDSWRQELDEILQSNDLARNTEGRLYYIVNTVREVLQTKDLETLHKVNFPLNIYMQEANPTVEKSDAFYAWQVEWGALRAGQDPDIREPPERHQEERPTMTQSFDMPKLPKRQAQHKDLMAKWKEQQQLRKLADPGKATGGVAAPSGLQLADRSPGGSQTSDSPVRHADPVQDVLDRYRASGHVKNTGRFGGALADAAAQASVLVPELQASYYEDDYYDYDVQEGWLEVQSPSGRIYYWNQITQEVWDPPDGEESFPPE